MVCRNLFSNYFGWRWFSLQSIKKRAAKIMSEQKKEIHAKDIFIGGDLSRRRRRHSTLDIRDRFTGFECLSQVMLKKTFLRLARIAILLATFSHFQTIEAETREKVEKIFFDLSRRQNKLEIHTKSLISYPWARKL